mgnify:CR=1 FL=1
MGTVESIAEQPNENRHAGGLKRHEIILEVARAVPLVRVRGILPLRRADGVPGAREPRPEAPRRSILVALVGAEEQGLLGARSYVANHLPDAASRDRIDAVLIEVFVDGLRDARACERPVRMQRGTSEGVGSTRILPMPRGPPGSRTT